MPWPTELRNNDVYIGVYMTWLYLVVMNIVPFLSLAVFNLAIYLEVRRANSERAQLTRKDKLLHRLSDIVTTSGQITRI